MRLRRRWKPLPPRQQVSASGPLPHSHSPLCSTTSTARTAVPSMPSRRPCGCSFRHLSTPLRFSSSLALFRRIKPSARRAQSEAAPPSQLLPRRPQNATRSRGPLLPCAYRREEGSSHRLGTAKLSATEWHQIGAPISRSVSKLNEQEQQRASNERWEEEEEEEHPCPHLERALLLKYSYWRERGRERDREGERESERVLYAGSRKRASQVRHCRPADGRH